MQQLFSAAGPHLTSSASKWLKGPDDKKGTKALDSDGPEIGTLIVFVIAAADLPYREKGKYQSPSCSVRFGSHQKSAATWSEPGQMPKWNQELSFPVYKSTDYHLEIYVSDGNFRTIGEASINLSNIVINGGAQKERWYHLSYQGMDSGEINLRIIFACSYTRPGKDTISLPTEQSQVRKNSATIEGANCPLTCDICGGSLQSPNWAVEGDFSAEITKDTCTCLEQITSAAIPGDDLDLLNNLSKPIRNFPGGSQPDSDQNNQPVAYSSRQSIPLGYYRCHYQSCWSALFSNLAGLKSHWLSSHAENFYFCDYAACQEFDNGQIVMFISSIFKTKSDLRSHFRSNHKEDLSMLSQWSKNEKELMENCRIGLEWWRCQSCLCRINVANQGYFCKACKEPCGRLWIEARRMYFGSSVSGVVPKPAILDGEKEAIVRGSDHYNRCKIGGCGMAFQRSEDLQRHQESFHLYSTTRPAPHSTRCQIKGCEIGFHRPEDLQRHHESVHSYFRTKTTRVGYQSWSSRIFTRRCDYRDCLGGSGGSPWSDMEHFRDYHREDLMGPLVEVTDKVKMNAWISTRNIWQEWWRCSQCLVRIKVQDSGWKCTSCNNVCESRRIEARKLRFESSETKETSVNQSNSPVLLGPAPPSSTLDAVEILDHEIPGSPSFNSMLKENLKDVSNVVFTTLDVRGSAEKAKQRVEAWKKQQLVRESQSTSEETTKPPSLSPTFDPNESPPPVDEQRTSLALIQNLIPTNNFSHYEYQNSRVVPFKTVKQLGYGSLGTVDAVHQDDDELEFQLARKVIDLPNRLRKSLLPLIQQEVAVLRALTHKHIVQVMSTYEITTSPRKFAILLWPVGEEDLSHFLERVGEDGFQEEEIGHLQKWKYCLVSAVNYIHCRNIRHTDIKPSNIICKGDDIFLTDFGSAHQFKSDLTSSTEGGNAAGFTRMYSAPEVMTRDHKGRPADIYSLGCVFAEITTVANGRRVEDFHDFRNAPHPDYPGQVTHAYYATAPQLETWLAMMDDTESTALLARMMAYDPFLRPKAKELLVILSDNAKYSTIACACVSGD